MSYINHLNTMGMIRESLISHVFSSALEADTNLLWWTGNPRLQLKAARLATGLTKEDFAKQIGMKPQAITKIEAGLVPPNVYALKLVKMGDEHNPVWFTQDRSVRLMAFFDHAEWNRLREDFARSPLGAAQGKTYVTDAHTCPDEKTVTERFDQLGLSFIDVIRYKNLLNCLPHDLSTKEFAEDVRCHSSLNDLLVQRLIALEDGRRLDRAIALQCAAQHKLDDSPVSPKTKDEGFSQSPSASLLASKPWSALQAYSALFDPQSPQQKEKQIQPSLSGPVTRKLLKIAQEGVELLSEHWLTEGITLSQERLAINLSERTAQEKESSTRIIKGDFTKFTVADINKLSKGSIDTPPRLLGALERECEALLFNLDDNRLYDAWHKLILPLKGKSLEDAYTAFRTKESQQASESPAKTIETSEVIHHSLQSVDENLGRAAGA